MAQAKGDRFTILDGKKIRELSKNEAEFDLYLAKAFDDLDTDKNGTLSCNELRPAFLKVCKLLGLPPPGGVAQLDTLVDSMFQMDGAPLSRSEFVSNAKKVLLETASFLEEDPLFVSVFSGVLVKELVSNQEAVDALTARAFEALDKDGSGKLSRSELLPVLKLLAGREGGLPPTEVIEVLEAALIARFGADGEVELDRAGFAGLFRELVAYLGDMLEEDPIVVVQSATVLNGYAIRKLLAEGGDFQKVAGEMFGRWDRSRRGKLNKADVMEGLKRLGLEIGLPPLEAREAERIYSDLFAASDFDGSGYVEEPEFALLLRALLLSLAAQLEANPLVVETSVSSMAHGARVVNGKDIFAVLRDNEAIERLLGERFDALDTNRDGTLNKSELKPALLRLGQLLGMPPPGTQEQVDRVVDGLFQVVVSEDATEAVDRDRFVRTAKDILREVASSLQDDPVVEVALDGSRLRTLLSSPSDFAEMSDNMFYSLDTDKSGQLSMQELKPALQELGLAMGIPPAGVRAEGDAIVAAAVEQYGHGKRELTREEFGMLLRDILADLASRLSTSPVVVGQSAKVLDGSRMRKLLASEEDFKALARGLFEEWDTSRTGRMSKADLTAGLRKLGLALGLPPPKARDAERVYNQLFVSADMDDSGFIDQKELLDFLRIMFTQIAGELEKNPVVVESAVVSW